MANEDTALECALLEQAGANVLSVNGSGSRSLPLLSRQPRQLTSIDISPDQIQLAQLRLASICQLSHAEFLCFWGYPPYHQAPPAEREKLFHRLQLPEDVRINFNQFFTANGFQSLLLVGKWEKTFQRLAKVARRVVGKSCDRLFEFTSLAEQIDYWRQTFPQWRWHLILRALGSARVFNALLYKGHFPKPNIRTNMFQFYRESFDRLVTTGLARENYFLQLCFLGELRYATGNPTEADSQLFQQMQTGFAPGKVLFHCGDLLEFVEQGPALYDFVSLSDVPSYFQPPREQDFLQILRPKLNPRAKVVLRSYRHRPEQMNMQGFRDITGSYKSLIERERVGVYHIEIFEREEEP